MKTEKSAQIAKNNGKKMSRTTKLCRQDTGKTQRCGFVAVVTGSWFGRLVGWLVGRLHLHHHRIVIIVTIWWIGGTVRSFARS